MNIKTYAYDIPGESKKPKAPACFLGAWYHKVFSSYDNWQGIEGTIILPSVDIKRFNGERNLDTPSIYIGGQAKYESDVGLTYSKGYILKDGVKTISSNAIVFRPFWRFITDQKVDVSMYDFDNDKFYAESNLTPNAITSNCYGHHSPDFTEYYYLPGDEIKLILWSPKENYLQLKIEVIKVSQLEESIRTRKLHQWKNPDTFISPLINSPGHGTNIKKTYKRVNAIDQSSNEGKPTIMTNTQVLNAIWTSFYLYRVINGEMIKVPLNAKRSDSMYCPYKEGFIVSKIKTNDGSSIVNIITEEGMKK